MKRQGGLPEFDYQPVHSDVLVLRRQDGTFVAAFGAREVTIEDIVEAATEDYSGSVEARANGASGLPEDEAPFQKTKPERPGAKEATVRGAGGDRARGDRSKAAGDARRGSEARPSEARPPPQPAE